VNVKIFEDGQQLQRELSAKTPQQTNKQVYRVSPPLPPMILLTIIDAILIVGNCMYQSEA
jgi:hypothetical protein